jgi:hypothetical protein
MFRDKREPDSDMAAVGQVAGDQGLNSRILKAVQWGLAIERSL